MFKNNCQLIAHLEKLYYFIFHSPQNLQAFAMIILRLCEILTANSAC